jgi:Tol biopolymer transport system component
VVGRGLHLVVVEQLGDVGEVDALAPQRGSNGSPCGVWVDAARVLAAVDAALGKGDPSRVAANPATRRMARLPTASLAGLLIVATSAGATFPGHNGLIAFVRPVDGVDSIAVISPNGGSAITLTTHARNPAWSPDGTRLAFDSSRSGDSNLYVADAHGRNVCELTNSGANEHSPAWSPDGKRLVFVLDDGLDYELDVIGADGTRWRVLFKQPGYYMAAPSWSPNGKWIAFLFESVAGAGRGQTELDVFLIHPNGKGLHQLTHTVGSEGAPSWTPDGTRLLFNGRHKGRDGTVVLTLRTGRARLLAGAASSSNPVWSPDGRTIAFARGSSIYLARPNGKNVRRLPTGSGSARDLDWQPLP